MSFRYLSFPDNARSRSTLAFRIIASSSEYWTERWLKRFVHYLLAIHIKYVFQRQPSVRKMNDGVRPRAGARSWWAFIRRSIIILMLMLGCWLSYWTVAMLIALACLRWRTQWDPLEFQAWKLPFEVAVVTVIYVHLIYVACDYWYVFTLRLTTVPLSIVLLQFQGLIFLGFSNLRVAGLSQKHHPTHYLLRHLSRKLQTTY